MTREDIIRMAREAFGAPYSSYLEKRSWDINDKQVEHFAALVAVAERKACAKLCEDHWRNNGNAMECADAIRARSEE